MTSKGDGQEWPRRRGFITCQDTCQLLPSRNLPHVARGWSSSTVNGLLLPFTVENIELCMYLYSSHRSTYGSTIVVKGGIREGKGVMARE